MSDLTLVARPMVMEDRMRINIDVKGLVLKVRELCLEGDFLKAQAILASSGMADDDVLRVLQGDKTLLSAPDGWHVVPEDGDVKGEYLAQVEEVFDGAIKHRGVLYRPLYDLGFKAVTEAMDDGFEAAQDGAAVMVILGDNLQPITYRRRTYVSRSRFGLSNEDDQDIIVIYDEDNYVALAYVNCPNFTDRFFGGSISGVMRKSIKDAVQAYVKRIKDDAERPTQVFVDGAIPTYRPIPYSNTIEPTMFDQTKKDPMLMSNDDYDYEVKRIRDEVRERSGPEDGPGWISLGPKDGKFYRVPKGPFLAWGNDRVAREQDLDLKSDWVPVSPYGMKLYGDSRPHSDWLIAMRVLEDGVWRDGDLDKDYRDMGLREVSYAKACRNQDVTFLVAGDTVRGTVVTPEEDGPLPPESILVVRSGGAEWSVAAMTAAAVIMEVGGELTHVVSVLRESNVPVVLIPDALIRYKAGMRLWISPSDGEVEIG